MFGKGFLVLRGGGFPTITFVYRCPSFLSSTINSRNSDPGSHSRLSRPLEKHDPLPSFFIASRLQPVPMDTGGISSRINPYPSLQWLLGTASSTPYRDTPVSWARARHRPPDTSVTPVVAPTNTPGADTSENALGKN